MTRPHALRILLVLAVLVAAYVRFGGLEANPLWYTDETNYISLAADLGQGTPLALAKHKALIFPFLTDAVPHPPLFFQVNGLLARFCGKTVLTGRALSGALGLLCMFLLYDAVRLCWGRMAGALAAGLFAFHLPSVFFLRWGMPYNLAMAFEVAAFWALARGQRGRRRTAWNIAAAAFAGGAAMSALFGLFALVFVSGLAGWRLWRGEVGMAAQAGTPAPHSAGRRLALAAVAVLVGCAPFALLLAIGGITRGEAFWRDFFALGFRASGGGGLGSAIEALAWQIRRLATRDAVYVVGLIGLIWIAIAGKRRRWTAVFFLFCALPVLVKRMRDPEIKYDEVMFLFLLYGSAGAALASGRRVAARAMRKAGRSLRWARNAAGAGACCVALGFVLPLAAMRVWQVATRLPSKYERFGSVLNIADARRLADWLNARVKEDDLVIAPERVDFLLRGHVTSVYQSVAFTAGSTTWHNGIERSRFAFDCDFRHARFIVVDFTDRALVLQPNNPNMNLLVDELNSGRWRQTEFGEYWVFENTKP